MERSLRPRTPLPVNTRERPESVAALDRIPTSYQAITEYFEQFTEAKPYLLREETMRRIEAITQRPLICYTMKTHNVGQVVPSSIDDGDLAGMMDLVRDIEGPAADMLLISNGGSPEAAERIVRLLRDRFASLRVLVPSNAFSAATLISMAADEIVMDIVGTLGPIDPQFNGIPARAILRAFETVEERLKNEGPAALTAYLPLLSKYDLHLLELCKSAQKLSEELAVTWLSTYMYRCEPSDPRVIECVQFFNSYDVHLSHGRSIDRELARSKGLKVTNLELLGEAADLVRSLANQFEIWFDKSSFSSRCSKTHMASTGGGKPRTSSYRFRKAYLPPRSPARRSRQSEHLRHPPLAPQVPTARICDAAAPRVRLEELWSPFCDAHAG